MRKEEETRMICVILGISGNLAVPHFFFFLLNESNNFYSVGCTNLT